MCYWTTPITATRASPAQLMMGRQIRTTIPTLEKTLQATPISHDQVQIKDSRAKKSYEHFYNRWHSVRPLPELHARTGCRSKAGWGKGMEDPCWGGWEISRTAILMTNGTVMRRNRKHLQALPESAKPTDQQHLSEESPTQPVNSPRPASVTREVGSLLGRSASESTQRTPLRPASSEETARLTSRGREVRLPLRFRDT